MIYLINVSRFKVSLAAPKWQLGYERSEGYNYLKTRWLLSANPLDFTSLSITEQQSNTMLRINMLCLH